MRNPGAFFTDATLLKKFPIANEGATYFEIRLEAQNVFNHSNFNKIDNNPTDPTFGGVLGKTGQRIMQIGARCSSKMRRGAGSSTIRLPSFPGVSLDAECSFAVGLSSFA